MSHIAKIELQIKDKEALKAAILELGGQYHPRPTFRLWRETPCESCATFPDEPHFELGFVREKATDRHLTAKWDTDSQPLNKRLGTNGERLKQLYGVHAASQTLRRQGYTVTRAMVGGKIKLTACKA